MPVLWWQEFTFYYFLFNNSTMRVLKHRSSLTWQYGGHSGDNEGHNDPWASHLLSNKPWDHIHPCPNTTAHAERYQVHSGQHPGQSGAMGAGTRCGWIQHGFHRFGPQNTGRKSIPCWAPLYPSRVQLPHQTTHPEVERCQSVILGCFRYWTLLLRSCLSKTPELKIWE